MTTPTTASRPRLGVLISGGGRTLLNLADRIDDGSLPAVIATVIASRHGLAGTERAEARGLPVTVVARADHADPAAVHDHIDALLDEAAVDLVCLAGYLRLFRVDPPYRGRVLNIHPALLPAFGGKGMFGQHVHEAVIAARRPFSGCTVHVVDEHYDHGPIVLQRACPVRPDDTASTLADRVFAEECIAYPEAIRLFAAGRLRIDDRRVTILPPT